MKNDDYCGKKMQLLMMVINNRQEIEARKHDAVDLFPCQDIAREAGGPNGTAALPLRQSPSLEGGKGQQPKGGGENQSSSSNCPGPTTTASALLPIAPPGGAVGRGRAAAVAVGKPPVARLVRAARLDQHLAQGAVVLPPEEGVVAGTRGLQEALLGAREPLRVKVGHHVHPAGPGRGQHQLPLGQGRLGVAGRGQGPRQRAPAACGRPVQDAGEAQPGPHHLRQPHGDGGLRHRRRRPPAVVQRGHVAHLGRRDSGQVRVEELHPLLLVHPLHHLEPAPQDEVRARRGRQHPRHARQRPVQETHRVQEALLQRPPAAQQARPLLPPVAGPPLQDVQVPRPAGHVQDGRRRRPTPPVPGFKQLHHGQMPVGHRLRQHGLQGVRRRPEGRRRRRRQALAGRRGLLRRVVQQVPQRLQVPVADNKK
eukprot:CAMPEP_0206371832 /NCGR_PEP_ID=MMETSP0294-20121207/6727_1 /ASSEMBLY_ACC=CAM_ASM_000327 /TAXON_ID=39354 /ORGANISM="Heterosigma akashiwo, Strain CCMP2393" /LENGTH=423 /DNA_ID=CAMNT_0053819053 /DNA_START=52 /DNA_END=1324 /DNA_ORIENTATION=-